MSSLIWECIRHNHAYLKKGHGPKTFSAEAGNMLAIHNYKFSGLAGKQTASLEVVRKNGKSAIQLVKKTSKAKCSRPNKLFSVTGVSKDTKKATNAIAKNLGGYRPDLLAAATTKYQKIRRSLRARK